MNNTETQRMDNTEKQRMDNTETQVNKKKTHNTKTMSNTDPTNKPE
jgi:hypothetical protein